MNHGFTNWVQRGTGSSKVPGGIVASSDGGGGEASEGDDCMRCGDSDRADGSWCVAGGGCTALVHCDDWVDRAGEDVGGEGEVVYRSRIWPKSKSAFASGDGTNRTLSIDINGLVSCWYLRKCWYAAGILSKVAGAAVAACYGLPPA